MATRSFLLDSQVPEGLNILHPEGATFPAGSETPARRLAFSLWLEARLLEKLETFGHFAELRPILLGSWSRHELSPKSDVDLLFAGEESKVKDFVAKAQRAGLKLRARTPEDLGDWRVGVEPFDILAVTTARPFAPEMTAPLDVQKKLARKLAPSILRAIRLEREDRHKRQDSISNYLEPNLKFGSGGLRDIEQALAIRELYPDKFATTDPYPFRVLVQIKDEFLYLRGLLHLMGSGDILSAHDQLELARRFQMDSAQVLMKFVQGELERASFYADWVIANAASSIQVRTEARKDLKSLSAAVKRLIARPSVLLEFQIRLKVDALAKPLSVVQKGKIVHQALSPDRTDRVLLSLHRARVFEVLLPDLKRLKGLVQHDHYHRFTADAHLVQTLREVQRAKSHRRGLGVLAKLTADLTASEWWTLKLTALFHDLAKGRKGDHSSEGARLVDKYFAEWGYSESLRAEVRWLVENHLILSTAAFRQNPQAQSTWKRLFAKGVHGRRLILLALFTAIDIRATNPEAWTDWKSQLLLDLVENLRSPEALSLQRHLKYATGENLTDVEEWLLKLDPVLLRALPPRILVEDLKAAALAKTDLVPKVLIAQDLMWIRFHNRADATGTFLGYVKRLYGLGLSIQMSAVATLPGVGVYDWFCLRTEKSVRQVSQWLALASNHGGPSTLKVPKVEFQSIDLMAHDQDEWIFSFRGRDQRGLLLSAAQALVEENLSLKWARAHTWGQQIDDIFAVQPLGEVESTLNRLRNRFVT